MIRTKTLPTAIYVRVSTSDQNPEGQIMALREYERNCGGDCIWYQDTASGRRVTRPAYQRLLRDIEAGRIKRVVVWRLDRLGRRVRELSKLLDEWQAKGVTLVSLREGIDMATPAGKMVAHILSSLAEYELEVRRERQEAGLAAARKRVNRVRLLAKNGHQVGQIAGLVGLDVETVKRILENPKLKYPWRPKKPHRRESRITEEKVRALLAKGLTAPHIAKLLGVAESTLYNWISTHGLSMTVMRREIKAQSASSP